MATSKKAVAIGVLATEAVAMLVDDEHLGLEEVAREVGICPSTVYRHWLRRFGAPRAQRRPRFLVLCAVMLEHIHRHEQTAAEIFSAVRGDYGTCGERRLWRALTHLVASGQVVRRGPPHHGCVYLRVVRMGA